ncbi:Defender against cell death 1 [Rhodotorula toruloides ATCC 204091]|uniref:Dolichyl-diphosphooligosaccharide--protein glycosyltransferase subunit OST2 n=1 Tax=Rhodotorula toruloides TaxID=5286 RepID=A0A0K3CCS0_RHOTO|nr:Defender against cell death 1 [Rhodotorula toruloides ATCC 204091]KAK4335228.1 Dolichyl-diphosphooligosaccharide--protein glycosyltransferase subunit OST2 [Rhodotorula toruloides]PRQ74514.1 defender against cell death 1 [Rhodotorula toruloides]
MPSRRVVSRSNTPAVSTAPADSAPSTAPAAASTSTATLAQSIKGKAKEHQSGFVGAVQDLWDSYLEHTAPRLKLIDSFMLFLMLTGIAQFAYCFGITNYPFNAFIGGFAATVGQFVLCAALRIQANPANKDTFPTLSPERAFGDFLFASMLLHFFVWNYLG